LGLTEHHGAVVGSVEEGSPAARTGLQAGDVIVAVDGRDISGSADLRNRIGLKPVGSEAEIAWLRDGEHHTARIRVEAEPGTAAAGGDFSRLSGAAFQQAPG